MVGPYKGGTYLSKSEFQECFFSKHHTQNRFYYYYIISHYYNQSPFLNTVLQSTKHNQYYQLIKIRNKNFIENIRRKLPGFCCNCIHIKFKTFTCEAKDRRIHTYPDCLEISTHQLLINSILHVM